MVLTFGMLLFASCGGGDDGDVVGSPGSKDDAATTSSTSASSGNASATTTRAASGGTPSASARVVKLGDEEIKIDRFLCYFKEQPRAGLGGVFTHTAQARGANGEGEPVVVDMSRAKAKDGTIEVDVTVDIGDPRSDDSVSFRASGGDGLVDFGNTSVRVAGVRVSDFGSDARTLSLDLACA